MSRTSTDRTHLPRVSVMMPVRNEAAYVARSLGAVLAQDYPSDLVEILVADGMSTDGTREIIEGMLPSHPNVTLLDNPGLIAPTALNLATKAASGDILVRVDGHCEIATDYVSGLRAAPSRMVWRASAGGWRRSAKMGHPRPSRSP